MFKALARLVLSFAAPRQAVPLDDASPGAMPILVSQSALDAFPTDPNPLVDSLVDYLRRVLAVNVQFLSQ